MFGSKEDVEENAIERLTSRIDYLEEKIEKILDVLEIDSSQFDKEEEIEDDNDDDNSDED